MSSLAKVESLSTCTADVDSIVLVILNFDEAVAQAWCEAQVVISEVEAFFSSSGQI
jgi:hypothetical protein